MAITTFQPITPTAAVARALQFVGQGWYRLGGGARYPSESPFGESWNQFPGFCDCSGFTAWACTYVRGNYNTDAIVKNARVGGAGARFRLVSKGMPVAPGDLIVYPGPDRDGDGERDHPGHIGIITEVLPDFVRGGDEWWESLRVAHCTPRKQKTLGAIKLTDAALWAQRGYIVRPAHYV